ncbi:Lsr2 family protein [Arthrobacter sp. NPDC080086]|uniref:histone-like nucleoid-structuring protein Lsr2 n=1 Tax=Arthrobacter sp. NPDC080086 TaxID=3155917 RepID=UPI0034504C10
MNLEFEIVWSLRLALAWGSSTANSSEGIPLARKVHVQLIDDISGEDAQESVRFALDDVEYEIDLAEDNAAALRKALAPYVAGGRRIRSSSAGLKTTASTSNRGQTQRIREWAEANGYNPSARGRISQDIMEAYNDAH